MADKPAREAKEASCTCNAVPGAIDARGRKERHTFAANGDRCALFPQEA